MKTPLNVSRGQILNFAANKIPISGIIVASEQTPGLYASVAVETIATIPDGARLTIPDLPEIGGCDVAYPIKRESFTRVTLSIGYSVIDYSTIGK